MMTRKITFTATDQQTGKEAAYELESGNGEFFVSDGLAKIGFKPQNSILTVRGGDGSRRRVTEPTKEPLRNRDRVIATPAKARASAQFLRVNGFVFSAYSEEGNEPAHVHVWKGGAKAKVWLTPVRVASSHLGKSDLRRALSIIREHIDELIEAWRTFRGLA